jgi:RNA recognition motif-containing protein
MGGGLRVYVGKLPRGYRTRDLEDLFYKYGRINDVTVRDGFGFVEFDDERSLLAQSRILPA